MKFNITEAFKLYVKKDAEGVMYVDRYKDNIEKIKSTFRDITALFPKTMEGQPDFAHVPIKEEEKKQFVKWMNELEQTLIKLR